MGRKESNQTNKTTPGRRQSKTLILSTKVDQKSLETEFSIAIVASLRQMAIEDAVSFDQHSSIVESVFDCCLSGVYTLCKCILPRYYDLDMLSK